MPITAPKLSVWIGIAVPVCGALLWLWNTAGTARHNRDVAAWTVEHQALQDRRQGWVVKQLGKAREKIEWDTYPE